MKVILNPHVLDAWQVTPGDGETLQTPPTWVVNGIIDGVIKAKHNGTLAVRCGKVDNPEVVVGDWLVSDGANIHVYRPTAFAALFQPYPPVRA